MCVNHSTALVGQNFRLYNNTLALTIAIKQRNTLDVYTHNGSVTEFEYANNSELVIVQLNDCYSIGAYGFFNCSNLVSISLPNTITKIGNRTFSDCSKLREIRILQGVTEIEEFTFSYCKSLSTVIFHDSVEIIANYAFRDDISIMEIELPRYLKTLGKSVFTGCSNLTIRGNNLPSTLTDLGPGTFSNCIRLTAISIPNSITILGNYLFNNCEKLTNVYFGPNISSIGDFCFYKCPFQSLPNLSNIISIGNYAFKSCSELKWLVLNPDIANLGEFAFGNCKIFNTYYDKSYNFRKLSEIKNGAFYNCPYIKVNLSDRCTKIGKSAFYSHIYHLDELLGELPSKIEYIGDSAFETNLLDFYIPDRFNGLNSYYGDFTRINLPNTLRYLGKHAFHYSKVIIDKIPLNFTYIPDYSLGGGYINLELPNSIISIGDKAFEYAYIEKMVIPNSCLSIGNAAFYGSLIHEITFGQNIQSIGKLCFFRAILDCGLNLPGTLKIINESTFLNCIFQSHLYFREGIEIIGKNAFMIEDIMWTYYDIESPIEITFPRSLKVIEEKAFYNSIYVSYIRFLCNDFTICDYAFYGVGNLNLSRRHEYYSYYKQYFGIESPFDYIKYTNVPYIEFYGLAYSSVFKTILEFDQFFYNGRTITFGKNAFSYSYLIATFPENLISIGDYCFNSSRLGNVEIPSSVQEIGTGAFFNASFINMKFSMYARPSIVGTNLFERTNIRSFLVPSFLSPLPHSTFLNCICLEEITISPFLKNIGESAFENCTSLSNVTLNTKMFNVLPRAFYLCKNLTCINLNGAIKIYQNAFDSCINLKMISMQNLNNLNEYGFRNCRSLLSITTGPNCIINELAFYGCSDIRIITFRAGSIIKNNAFYGCPLINSIILEDDVKFDETPFDNQNEGQLQIFYIGDKYIYSENITKYIYNVTVYDNFTQPDFMGKSPNKVLNTTMIEKINDLTRQYTKDCIHYEVIIPKIKTKINRFKHFGIFHESILSNYIALFR